MKKSNANQILALTALALGAAAIGKVIYDVKKIKRLTEEKEEMSLNEGLESEEVPAAEKISEEEAVAEEAAPEEAPAVADSTEPNDTAAE